MCAIVIEQILNALSYLHEKEIVHLKIFPANIMFKSNKKDNFELKISEYDLFNEFTP